MLKKEAEAASANAANDGLKPVYTQRGQNTKGVKMKWKMGLT